MKAKTALLGTLALVTALAVPALTHADTYEYVSTSGNLETVTANTAEQALVIPTDIAPNSGVILLADMSVVNTYPVTTTPETTTTVVANPTTTTTIYPSSTDTSSNTSTSVTSTYNSEYAGTYVDNVATTTTTSSTQSVTLVLNEDGMATLTMGYDNGEPSTTENGMWQVLTTSNAANEIQLTLTNTDTASSSQSPVIIYDVTNNSLTPSQYDSNDYSAGSDVLTKQN